MELADFLIYHIGPETDELQATVLKMVNTLHHRGPDDSGAWADALKQESRWGIAACRLWICPPKGSNRCAPYAVGT